MTDFICFFMSLAIGIISYGKPDLMVEAAAILFFTKAMQNKAVTSPFAHLVVKGTTRLLKKQVTVSAADVVKNQE